MKFDTQQWLMSTMTSCLHRLFPLANKRFLSLHETILFNKSNNSSLTCALFHLVKLAAKLLRHCFFLESTKGMHCILTSS